MLARYAQISSALGSLRRIADPAPPDAVLTFAPCLGMLLLLGSLQHSTKQRLGVVVTMLHRAGASMHDADKLLQSLVDVPCADHLHSTRRKCESSLSRQDSSMLGLAHKYQQKHAHCYTAERQLFRSSHSTESALMSCSAPACSLTSADIRDFAAARLSKESHQYHGTGRTFCRDLLEKGSAGNAAHLSGLSLASLRGAKSP